jgi:4-hydroxy-tetrahydrodipicolinate synthase
MASCPSRRTCCRARCGGFATCRAARALDARLQPVFAFLGAEPNPIPLKALLARMQLGHGLRLPLTTLSPALAGDADRAVAAVNEIEHACRDPLAA